MYAYTCMYKADFPYWYYYKIKALIEQFIAYSEFHTFETLASMWDYTVVGLLSYVYASLFGNLGDCPHFKTDR